MESIPWKGKPVTQLLWLFTIGIMAEMQLRNPIVFSVLMLTVACGSSPEGTDPLPLVPAPKVALILSPDVELAKEVQASLDRWSNALTLGCPHVSFDLRIGAEGAPVRIYDLVRGREEGTFVRSKAFCFPDDEIAISRIPISYPGQVELMLDHEIGHLLSGCIGHSDGGVMRASAQINDVMDVTSVNLVCHLSASRRSRASISVMVSPVRECVTPSARSESRRSRVLLVNDESGCSCPTRAIGGVVVAPST
jgi:hypothetical protein